MSGHINKLKEYLTGIFLDQKAKDIGQVDIPKEYFEKSHDAGLTYEESGQLVRSTWDEFVYFKGVTLTVYLRRTFKANGCI